MGGQHYQEAVLALENNDFSLVADLTLHYYDKAYLHGLEQRKEASIRKLVLNTLETKSQTDAVIQELSINFIEK
jgi:tRNA 2-selenouridine synthase